MNSDNKRINGLESSNYVGSMGLEVDVESRGDDVATIMQRSMRLVIEVQAGVSCHTLVRPKRGDWFSKADRLHPSVIASFKYYNILLTDYN